MKDQNTKASNTLKEYRIKASKVHYQLSPEELHDLSIEKGMGEETASGALVVNTGEFTGRSPMDRFIVEDALTKEKVSWGNINVPFDSEKFDALYDKVVDYLSGKELYVRDCYACALEEYRYGIKVINEYPWSNLFAYNMFIRPSIKELKDFKTDWTVINAPGFFANPEVDGTRQHNFSILNFSRKIVLIGGSGYTGEIKKGIFSSLNFELPVNRNTLPMHCSANIGEGGDTAIFFGLSGTGKTTLSADSKRKLIGDDEHGWTQTDQIFNFEGGCYAKVINLSAENEPEIFGAIKKGALLENVVIKKGEVDFDDISITQNTRVSYPIEHIENVKLPSVGKNPKNIFFLTADAFGVLPPLSKLTPGQAAYHFMSGYTAKVAGTEAGVIEPQPSFSACFGAPFMPLHPAEYAQMLNDKIKDSGVNVWLVNTGWIGGAYGVGKRIKLQYTRAMINAVLNGDIDPSYSYEKYHIHSVFGVVQPRHCPGVPDSVLSPRSTWDNDQAYYLAAFKLANAFRENFKKFESNASDEIRRGGPQRFVF